MNSLLLQLGRPVALCLSFFVTAQMTATALPLQQNQQPAPAQQTQPATPDSQSTQQPATNQQAQPIAPAQQPGEPAQAPAPAAQTNEGTPGFASRSQDGTQNVEQRDAQNPVGTAAAPLTRPSGIAGSRPAGAAIAPAKQKRVKAIFIRVALIVAGAAAAGAVIGLSKGSPSHPQ
jgi:hypothetical protein